VPAKNTTDGIRAVKGAQIIEPVRGRPGAQSRAYQLTS
jgi:hypothetical protein